MNFPTVAYNVNLFTLAQLNNARENVSSWFGIADTHTSPSCSLLLLTDNDFCNETNQTQVDSINHIPTSCSKKILCSLSLQMFKVLYGQGFQVWQGAEGRGGL